MILQVHTEKELIDMIHSLKKELEQFRTQNKSTIKKLQSMQAEINKKPNVQIKETVIKEIEKPTVKEVTLIQTDPSVIPTIKKISDRLKCLENKPVELQQVIHTKETKIDVSIMPTLKKLSSRVKALEEAKPEPQIIKELTTHEVKYVSEASKKEIEDIKKSILNIKPVVNNLTSGVTSQDVLELIKKHVILSYINKLYGR
jgi:hypothetical protein